MYGVYSQCLETGTSKLSKEPKPPQADISVHHNLVFDGACPFKSYLMKPFEKYIHHRKNKYINRRLSRVRKKSLSRAKWRILDKSV
jgi:hypothetical protein